MLPLEAIELDAFRRRHEHDTYWCGLLLGGCGMQLTTKLYTDRVCHFAHHPGPDGHPHLCGRRARGVASADHLYVKSAARSWLHARGEEADFDFARPDGAAIGSVLDIRFKARGLRVHLDQTVVPVWDEDGVEPVLGVSVPVDRDTLIRRWYVHRVRLDSEGTARRVRIGTEAFARPTEWFTLDECKMTERGLSTPAVEQIVRSRSTRPTSTWSAVKTVKVPPAQARAQTLLRKLDEARLVGSVVVVARVRREIAALTGVEGELQDQLVAAIADADRWLEEQAQARQELFHDLEQAVAEQEAGLVRPLLVRANAVASHDRTEAETAIADAAAECLASHARQRQAEVAVVRAAQAEERARGEAERVKELLAALESRGIGQPRRAMREMVQNLVRAAAGAGAYVDAQQRRQIEVWTRRAEGAGALAQIARQKKAPLPPRAARPKRTSLLHEQVGRRSWFKEPCPRCQAPKGRYCFNDDDSGGRDRRPLPHEERLKLIISTRNARPKQTAQRLPAQPQPASPTWQVRDVACPECDAAPGRNCTTSDGRPHQCRTEHFRRRFPSA
ncbi:hypothetical protein [Streptomyces peucetius]|uniref:Competence protein CoiA-like protein n=1 Tax=Streptomyces peucetius TaxID=1950 RepID=A0ABY6IHG4_STRPE|nr:hypothetical protein [Streptomyces peucetius]UYQ66336.1 hypothetical protein OGH68_00280 [Streptomyces peucetius]